MWSFQRPPAKTGLMRKLTEREKRGVTIQFLQCYNYSSFSPLDEHKEGLSSLPQHILFSPPLAAQLGELALIAPKSWRSTTSTSHPGVIVTVGVGGLEKKGGFSAYRRGLCVTSQEQRTCERTNVMAHSAGDTREGK